MKKYTIEKYNEKYYEEILENGLKVILVPKKINQEVRASFVIKFGGSDLEFKLENENEFFKANEGIAHFLEHKLFESSDGVDALDLFDKFSGSANAYTSDDRTVYYFQTQSFVLENLNILMDLVQKPYFTDESVKKEVGIIEQEINATKNDVFNHLEEHLQANIYHNQKSQIDIGGSFSSISKITKEELYKCYHTFYNPSNMALIVVGDFKLKDVLSFIKEKQKEFTYETKGKIIRKTYEEKALCVNKTNSSYFDIAYPLSSVAYKEKVGAISELEKEILATNMMMFFRYYFGISSPFYIEGVKEGVIESSFNYVINIENEYLDIRFMTRCTDPKAFKKYLEKELKKIKLDEIPYKYFEGVKKQMTSANIRIFNSEMKITDMHVKAFYNDYNVIDFLEKRLEIDYETFKNLKNYLNLENSSFHTVFPLKKKTR